MTAERGRELAQSGVDCVGAGYIAPEDVGEYAEAEGGDEYVLAFTPRGAREAAGVRIRKPTSVNTEPSVLTAVGDRPTLLRPISVLTAFFMLMLKESNETITMISMEFLHAMLLKPWIVSLKFILDLAILIPLFPLFFAECSVFPTFLRGICAYLTKVGCFF